MQIEFEKILDPAGLLSQSFPGYEVRDSQEKMLRDVWKAFQEDKIALIEAGTGTGKSLAYLIPAILWARSKGEPVVISTNTISLQEQLLQKDIPTLLSVLKIDLSAVLVKGMGNYLCRRKIEDASIERRLWSDQEKREFARIEESLEGLQEGSRSELEFFPSPETWDRVNAQAEECTFVKCPHYKKCFFFKERQKVADASLLIVNHHLLFADFAARKESGNYSQTCILPPYSRLIIDEAHHIEEVATEYFASKVSRIGLIKSLGKLISEKGAGKLKILDQKIAEAYPSQEKSQNVRNWHEKLQIYLPAEKRVLLDQVERCFSLIEEFLSFWNVDEKLRFLEKHLHHPSWVQSVQPQIELLLQKLLGWSYSLTGLLKEIEQDENLKGKCEGIATEIEAQCVKLEEFCHILRTFSFELPPTGEVRWLEGKGAFLSFISAPLEISSLLSEGLFSKLSTILLCSATLTANGNFHFIRKNLGIPSCIEKIYPSPFDYQKQAVLAAPLDMPDPDHPLYVDEVAKKIEKLVEISKGGVFVLFTSYHMLRSCEEKLSSSLDRKGYTLFSQGSSSRQQLLSKFREAKQAVLFGTDSFWEGVDVIGEALRCVIIAKLPFRVPSDPLFQARCEAILERGGSPFFEYSLPHAIVKFKQGFGRLIRSATDRGSVICLDPRIAKKGYGKQFLKGLPSCKLFFEDASKIFREIDLFYKNSDC